MGDLRAVEERMRADGLIKRLFMVAKTILQLNMTGKLFNKVDNTRAILIALLMTIASQAGAECGNLCDRYWWGKATTANLQAELDAGSDVMGRNSDNKTPLHIAAEFGYLSPFKGSGAILALLKTGADAKSKDENRKTPWDIA